MNVVLEGRDINVLVPPAHYTLIDDGLQALQDRHRVLIRTFGPLLLECRALGLVWRPFAGWWSWLREGLSLGLPRPNRIERCF